MSWNKLDREWVAGFVVACAEMSHTGCDTAIEDALCAAGITATMATECGVSDYDMRALRRIWPRVFGRIGTKMPKGRTISRQCGSSRTRLAEARAKVKVRR